MIAPGTIVVIEWRDAVTRNGWITPEQAKAWEPCAMRTVGYLVVQNDSRVTVMQSFNDEQVTGVFTIPAPWIVSIRALAVPA